MAAAAVVFTFIYFPHLEFGDVLAAFLCLVLAHRARGTGGRVGGFGVLGFEEVEHGNPDGKVARGGRRIDETGEHL